MKSVPRNEVHPPRARCHCGHLDQPVDQTFVDLSIAHHLREFLIQKPVWLPPVDDSICIGKVERHELGKVAGQRRLPRRFEVVRGGIVLIRAAFVPGGSGPKDSAGGTERHLWRASPLGDGLALRSRRRGGSPPTREGAAWTWSGGRPARWAMGLQCSKSPRVASKPGSHSGFGSGAEALEPGKTGAKWTL